MSIAHVCDACGRKIKAERAIEVKLTTLRLLDDLHPQLPAGAAPAAWEAFPAASVVYHVHDGPDCLAKIGGKLAPVETAEPLPPAAQQHVLVMATGIAQRDPEAAARLREATAPDETHDG